MQFGEEGAGLLSVVAAHPAAEFVVGGYASGELQLAWSPDGFHLAVGNDTGGMLVVDLRR